MQSRRDHREDRTVVAARHDGRPLRRVRRGDDRSRRPARHRRPASAVQLHLVRLRRRRSRRSNEFAASGEFPTQPDYMRYWHGYAVFTRPALAIFGLSGHSLVGVRHPRARRSWRSPAACSRRFGVVPMVVVLVPGLLTTDMIVGGWSIAQALGLATAWVGGWIVLPQASAERTWQVVALAAALGGAINAYFDLMVAIPASLALCAVARRVGDVAPPSERVDARRWCGRWPSPSGGWAVGLGGMWASKWAFAWLFVDRRARSSTACATRSRSGPAATTKGSPGRGSPGFTKNVDFWLDRAADAARRRRERSVTVGVGGVAPSPTRSGGPAPAWIAGMRSPSSPFR